VLLWEISVAIWHSVCAFNSNCYELSEPSFERKTELLKGDTKGFPILPKSK